MNNHRQIEKDFDVLIVGGGAAGLSAALWCDDLGLSALLVEASGELGGQLLRVYNPIKNHLGGEAENGRQMRDLFVKQTDERKFTLKLSSKITEIDFDEKIIFLESGERFTGRSIILATGVRRRKLNVAGEREFENKGIVESGKRDGKFLNKRKVLIVGSGDAAFENALILAETAGAVTLACRSANFRAGRNFTEKVLQNPKIKILTGFTVREILGNQNIEAVELENPATGESIRLPADAVLIRAGVEPNTEIVRGKIDLDADGYIKTDACGETVIRNIFAVGDTANPISPTVSTAVGSGATAVKAIYKRLKS